jgi:hypothetical protein
MRTFGQLVICVLLAGPSGHAAFGPWDLDIDTAASIARTVEQHVTHQSARLALYLEVPSAQLRAIADLPLFRELARSLRLWEVGRLLTAGRPRWTQATCRQPG